MNLRMPPIDGGGATASGSSGSGKSGAQGFSTLAEVAAAAGAAGTQSLPKPKKLGGMLVLLVVIIVAAGLLFGMRKLGTSRRLQMVDFKIDYPVEKAELARLSKDHEEVLAELRSTGQIVQVPLDQVQTNPFEWKLIEKQVQSAKPDDSALAAERSRREAEERKRTIESQAAMLKLNSVIGGRTPVAQVSGKLVKIGDVIDEMFTVTRIEGRSIEITAEGMAFTLTIGEQK